MEHVKHIIPILFCASEFRQKKQTKKKIAIPNSYQIGIIGSGEKLRRGCPAAAAASAKSAGTMSDFPRTTHLFTGINRIRQIHESLSQTAENKSQIPSPRKRTLNPCSPDLQHRRQAS